MSSSKTYKSRPFSDGQNEYLVCQLGTSDHKYLMSQLDKIQVKLCLEDEHLAKLGLKEWEFYTMDAEMKQLVIKRPLTKYAQKA